MIALWCERAEVTDMELYDQIIETYKETGSVKETAEKLGTYPIKVRRVLITEGLWRSKTSDAIGELYRQGRTTSASISVSFCT